MFFGLSVDTEERGEWDWGCIVMQDACWGTDKTANGCL